MYNLVGLKRQCIRAVNDKDAVKTISYLATSRLKKAKIMAGAILCRLAQETECCARLVAAGKYFKAKERASRMEHCSYRYSVLFDLIPLLMSSIEL